jgi:molybdenum cofactor cytidylyltransferase
MRNVGAVILAAGASTRLGQPKQLLTFRGETLIYRAVRAATEAGCDPVLVVVGETGDAIRRELQSTSATFMENPHWQRGPGTSIRCGLEHLPDSVDAVVVLACDQPFLDASIVRKLIDAHEVTGKPIVASSYADTLGIPALFHRAKFEQLVGLPDAMGAKSLITRQPDHVASIAFEGGAIDIDTPEDFERLKENHR